MYVNEVIVKECTSIPSFSVCDLNLHPCHCSFADQSDILAKNSKLRAGSAVENSGTKKSRVEGHDAANSWACELEPTAGTSLQQVATSDTPSLCAVADVDTAVEMEHVSRENALALRAVESFASACVGPSGLGVFGSYLSADPGTSPAAGVTSDVEVKMTNVRAGWLLDSHCHHQCLLYV